MMDLFAHNIGNENILEVALDVCVRLMTCHVFNVARTFFIIYSQNNEYVATNFLRTLRKYINYDDNLHASIALAFHVV